MTTSESLHPDLDIAVTHGNYIGRGGGERVAEAIARTFDAPIYYGFGDSEHTPEDIETHALFNDLPGSGIIQRVFQLRDLYYMYGWRSVPELHEYDVVIQSGNEPGWYKPLEDQVVIKYTHSTPRNAYDRYPYREPDRGLIYDAYCFATEQLYQPVLSYPDRYVANSDVVKRRIQKYWRRGSDVDVVYPPVETASLGQANAANSPIDEPFYLVLDRLEPTKHVDEVVSAFREHSDKRLVVAGTGSQEGALQEQARDLQNVTFRGYVSEEEKQALLADAEALCYAAEDEDFGIVPIESLASGTPVLGPREGFTQHQISDGETGHLYERDGPGIVSAIERFDTHGVTGSPTQLERVADRYAVDRFRTELREIVSDAVDEARIDADVDTVPDQSADEPLQPAIADGGPECN